MCSHKCFRMPTLIICGVVLTIILVCITGITLTNSINISNIVKLREKVASDSAAANGGHQAAQTRAALVEQQYSTLQQHHMSRSDLNYISASTHPKNLQRLLASSSSSSSSSVAASASSSASSGSQQQPIANQNKIVIEIGLRNSGNNDSAAGATPAIPMMPMPHMLQAAEALMEGNVDSISLPAVAAPLPQAATTTTTTTKATSSTEATPFDTSAELLLQHPKADQTMAINDHNPAGIQFERRSHVKQVHREKKSVKFK